jgi:hypothetical protein
MISAEQRSVAVTASGVIAILGSLFAGIGVLFALLGLLIASTRPSPSLILPSVRFITGAIMFGFLFVALWGIFSGVGLIRFRNWARISVLVWSGIAAPFCLLAMAAMVFVPLPPTPNSPMPGAVLRLIVIAFYGAPLAIAVWWLILFTRPRIVEQFRAVAAGAPGDPFTVLPPPTTATAITDSSDLPTTGSALPPPATYTVAAPPTRPSMPLPVIVLACFFLISSLSIFFTFFMHMPAMVFGRAFTGLTGSVIYAVWCMLYAVSGVGMLRRVSWAYSVAIALQVLGIVSGIMTLLSSNFDEVMRRAMSHMSLPPPEVYSAPSMAHLRGFSVIGLVFPLAILGLLAYYRPRFLASAQPLRVANTAIEPTI